MIKFLFLLFCFCFSLDSADEVVAVVGNYPISKSSVLQSAQMFLVQKGKQTFSSQEELDFLLNESLKNIINQRVLFEKAKQDTTIIVTNDEVVLYIENHINNLILQHGSKEILEAALGQNISSFKKESWEDVYKLIITERFQQKLLEGFDVSIKDVIDFYNENIDSLPVLPAQYKYSIIDVPVVPGEEVKKAAFSFLSNLKDSIKKSSFDLIAKKYSDDPGSANNGGDLGYIKRGTLVKEFERVAFSLNIDEISSPILSPFGYHLILLVDKKGEKIRTKHILKTIKASDKDKNFSKNKIKEYYNFLSLFPEKFDSIALNLSNNINNKSKVNDWLFLSEIDSYIIKELNTLNNGTISFPVEVEDRYQLIKLYLKKPEEKPTIKNSWSLLKNMAYQNKAIKKIESLLNVYKKDIYIKYYN